MAKTVVGHLVDNITGDSKELNDSLKKSQTQTVKFTRFMKSALGIGGAVIALRSLIRIGKDLVAAYGVQEQAENRLVTSASGESRLCDAAQRVLQVYLGADVQLLQHWLLRPDGLLK